MDNAYSSEIFKFYHFRKFLHYQRQWLAFIQTLLRATLQLQGDRVLKNIQNSLRFLFLDTLFLCIDFSELIYSYLDFCQLYWLVS